MAAVALQDEVRVVDPAYDRGVTRLAEKVVEEIDSGAVSPLEGLTGLLDVLAHRPQLVRRLGRETDSRLAKHRQRSRERYHLQKAKREAERAKLEDVIVAA
jgi:chorismate mutase